ncbi:uncharacterized protein LOC130979442 [Arachis stenosperma]|uniref:uncharacterized protein LOC130979442 n=1 Tax=Arachis stenosperma TaxID=217475 RepID=UPI0025ABA069|nr:uncharacterized protein LOC130979442 [Arachis stenosperma]
MSMIISSWSSTRFAAWSPTSPCSSSSTTPLLNSVNNASSLLPSRTRKLKALISKAIEKNQSPTVTVDSAADVVRNFYGGINSRDLDSVEDLIALNCVYEDLVFPRPFVGRKEILEFFRHFTNATSTDLQFVIDDLSTNDHSSVGVTWHLEWKGKPFPFSRGCSFYRLEVINGKKQITYGRDCVEPAIKPGDAALAIIRGVTWLLQQFPQLVDRL